MEKHRVMETYRDIQRQRQTYRDKDRHTETKTDMQRQRQTYRDKLRSMETPFMENHMKVSNLKDWFY